MFGPRLDDSLLAEAVADAALNDDGLADLWDNWSSHWEREFSRLSSLEGEWAKRGAERICHEAKREVQYKHLEHAAKVARETEEEMEEMRRERARQQVREDATHARKQAAADAFDFADDLVSQLAEKRKQKREADEARRKKEREAAWEAQRKRFHDPPKQAPPRPSADAPTAPGMPRQAPRRPRSSSLSKEGGPPSARPPPARFSSFSEFDTYWTRFEQRVSGGARDLNLIDVPWPTSLVTVSGVSADERLEERKKKLRAALVRWHPDKWCKLLESINECDRAKVIEKVKEVTRRIIEEKKRYGA